MFRLSRLGDLAAGSLYSYFPLTFLSTSVLPNRRICIITRLTFILKFEHLPDSRTGYRLYVFSVRTTEVFGANQTYRRHIRLIGRSALLPRVHIFKIALSAVAVICFRTDHTGFHVKILVIFQTSMQTRFSAASGFAFAGFAKIRSSDFFTEKPKFQKSDHLIFAQKSVPRSEIRSGNSKISQKSPEIS